MAIRIVSNKDGCSGDRQVTFSSYEPCTYKIYDSTDEVGSIEQSGHFAYGSAWYVFFNDGRESECFQTFSDAKKYAKTGIKGKWSGSFARNGFREVA